MSISGKLLNNAYRALRILIILVVKRRKVKLKTFCLSQEKKNITNSYKVYIQSFKKG
jgi:hypothetical protein